MMITTNKDKDQTKKGCEDSWHEELKSKEKKTIHNNAGVLLLQKKKKEKRDFHGRIKRLGRLAVEI